MPYVYMGMVFNCISVLNIVCGIKHCIMVPILHIILTVLEIPRVKWEGGGKGWDDLGLITHWVLTREKSVNEEI